MTAIVTWKNHSGERLANVKGFDVIACTNCGFSHAVPLPNADELEQNYREDYYGTEKPTFIAHAEEDEDWSELFWRDRLAIFAQLLSPSRRRLLDIGCGPGFFLKVAQSEGWQCKGIEPSRQASAFARSFGLDIVEGFFNAETATNLGAFDVVHLNNVLEHIPNATELISLAGDRLQAGGVICINVPNDFTPAQQSAVAALGLPQWWVAPPHHLNYFNFASLTSLLERNGFLVNARTTSFPMEQFLLMGINYVADPQLGRACHKQRKAFDMALDNQARRDYYKALAAAGFGREAVVMGTKK